MALLKPCPSCGHEILFYRNPVPTVDVVIFIPGQGVVLIKRQNPPPGWALPGGFVDYGETVEQAAVREALEETGLEVTLTGLLGVYSDPERDPRMHTLSVVYTAKTKDPATLNAGDDAAEAKIFPLDELPAKLAFDHGRILGDFVASIAEGDAPDL
ncbi:MAG: NUDIX hydrolase [Thermodesulfobacteriota bacterium]|nr:NUDIX hydrolase [Thermodesulfobacteriota bacterium]